jgi:hypothetical protein
VVAASSGSYDVSVADVLFVAIVVAFFALALLFVAGCVRLVGAEESER